MNVKIRKATIDDLKDILALNQYLTPNNVSFEESKKIFTKFIKSGVFTQFVAETDKKIVGIMSIILLPGYVDHEKVIGYLQRLVVHPEYRHQGVGSMLIKTCLDFAKDKCYKVILHSSNEDAIKIYEKLGFKKHSTLLEYRG